MKLFQQIERINTLHKLITHNKTGTPEVLAKRLHISASRLYCIIDELKLMGAPINYSRQLRTYYYEYDYEIGIEVNFKPLTPHELKLVVGGSQIITMKNSNNFSTAFFV